jgi:tetratricopeptide (TPR) repeat protein
MSAEPPDDVSIALRLELWDENPRLRGRDAVLAKLRDPIERVWVLYGLGGCGKTRLAQEVAFRARDRLREAWWVSAEEVGGLVASMRALGRHLDIPAAALEQGDAADVIWRGLLDRPDPWLLVIDGADDPKILAGAGKSVAEGRGWLRPVSAKTGMVLVTSRDGSPGSWAQEWCRRFHVEMLPADEAAGVLADYAGRSPGLGGDDDARRLAVRLGGLPLALRLAGSYLSDLANTPLPFAGPIRTYRQYQDAIENAALRRPGGEMTQERATELIGQTGGLALNVLEERQVPEARPMLGLLASFAAAPIPYALLLDPGLLAACPPFQDITGSGIWHILTALDDFDLIDLDFSGEDPDKIWRGEDPDKIWVARLHPLVRDASQPAGSHERMFLNLAALLLKRAAAAKEAEQPEDPKRWPVWQLLAPHPGYVLDKLEREPEYPADVAEAAAYAAQGAARYYAARGLHLQAETQFQTVLTARLRVLGADHPDTLTTRHDIARMMQLQGSYAKAEDQFRAVLRARRRVLGVGDPDTLDTRHEIARTMAARREYAKAEDQFRAVLKARKRRLGADHPDTLITRHEIARMMAEQENRADAEDEFRNVLEARTRVLGDDNPDTLTTQHEIARVMADQGNHGEAEDEFRNVLEARRRVLGDSNPDTLTTRHEIARMMAEQDDHAGAETEFRNVLEARTRKLGPEHRDTLITRHEIARQMADQGKYAEAQAESRDILAISQDVLGPDHMITLIARHELARVMALLGDYAGAEAEFRDVLEARTRKLGADHPHTQITRDALDRVIAAQGDRRGGEAEDRDV